MGKAGAFGGDAALGLGQRDQFHIAAHELGIGVLRVHHHAWEIAFAEHLFLQFFNVIADVKVVHFLAQLADGVVL
ncbi:hypothetical protein AK51_23105 [Serratia nematodiphila DZ0503SBS1]|nr:hypothetical protein AK51_23105 [Serratia nematodiphila DZ0503SBS1]